MDRSVVVGVDGTGRSIRALLWAAQDAILRHATLKVVHTLPRYQADIPFFPPGRFEEAVERGRSITAEALAVVRQTYPDLACTVEMPTRTPVAALIAEAEDAATVVVGGKGEDFGNLLLGSTALQLVGHARCPVVVVEHVSAGHGRIVVGTDGSQTAAAAVAFGFEEARLRNAELQVISALGLPQGWPSHLLRPLPEDDDEVAFRRRAAEHQIALLSEEHPGVQVSLNVHRVAPLEALEAASHHADLMVLGSRGHGGFHGLAVGSTTHKMLHFATCPLAVVPTGRVLEDAL